MRDQPRLCGLGFREAAGVAEPIHVRSSSTDVAVVLAEGAVSIDLEEDLGVSHAKNVGCKSAAGPGNHRVEAARAARMHRRAVPGYGVWVPGEDERCGGKDEGEK